MVESALDSETQVRGFADRLGERFIVPQPSGSLLEHLQFRRDLSSAPFFEPAVKERLARLANFRHASYTRARRLRSGDRGALILVSTHVPGRHLSEVLHTAGRNGFRPPTAAVLWLTRQLLTSVALLHDYGPDVFHGAIGPERVILAGEGRVVLAEVRSRDGGGAGRRAMGRPPLVARAAAGDARRLQPLRLRPEG